MSENPKTIKVVDRRLFTPEGEVARRRRGRGGGARASGGGPRGARGCRARRARRGAVGHEPGVPRLLDMLAQTGLLYLEGVPDAAGRRQPNVPGARQIVDALLALRDKTRGQLSFEETDALEGILGELQLVFTRLAAGPRPKGPVPPPPTRRG